MPALRSEVKIDFSAAQKNKRRLDALYYNGGITTKGFIFVMCTYHRQLKNGNIQEFVFELNRNKYELVSPTGLDFSFTIEDRFVHFTIDTHKRENQGYGSALLSIVFEYATKNHLDFVCGNLSTSDYHNKNWETSIPFYLHRHPNSFLIKESDRMRNIYPKFKNFQELSNNYIHYYDYYNFTENVDDGYIIYPMKLFIAPK